MFPFGIFPFNVLPTANPWWASQAAQNQSDLQKNMPPFVKAYFDAYATWMTMMTQANPFLKNFNQPPEK